MAYADIEKSRAAKRAHYHKNKEQYKLRNTQRKLEMRNYLIELKRVPCMDCGNSYPFYCMDFDHRDPSEKEGNIGQIVNNGSWNKLYAEVAKCDVVCANCHRIRTAKKSNWTPDQLYK
ncbi:HNH endonuclease [Streptomyces phage StarPlatinum]|uniref:HNH endonuclease n=1 Tax=Streptomyces phage StarPlatinum TaxID=2283265 RepID=A0A345M8N0_9CAUD|nr:HNH endonuclease [Streptomyces phage StarPlatinum]AXH66851.1 HNH endonuclease [Streptomyces phage StarPlatinum]